MQLSLSGALEIELVAPMRRWAICHSNAVRFSMKKSLPELPKPRVRVRVGVGLGLGLAVRFSMKKSLPELPKP